MNEDELIACENAIISDMYGPDKNAFTPQSFPLWIRECRMRIDNDDEAFDDYYPIVGWITDRKKDGGFQLVPVVTQDRDEVAPVAVIYTQPADNRTYTFGSYVVDQIWRDEETRAEREGI